MEPHRRITDDIDIYKTSRSICDEVGATGPSSSRMPPYLKRLIDELRKRDE